MTNTDKPMELNDAISRLLKSGVVKVTFGQRDDNTIGVMAEQMLNAGEQHFMHQASDVTAEEGFNKVLRSVEHAAQLQDTILKIPRNGKLK